MLSWWNRNARRKHGWKKDLHDERDFMLTFTKNNADHVDLRPKCPPVYDQGQLGSCTANAVCGAYQYDEKYEELEAAIIPSRLFLYYNTRVIEHTQDADSGATIRDTIKSLAKTGVCTESMWPYDINRFAQEPTKDCYGCSSKHKSLTYKRLNQTEEQLEACLASGFPICFGVMVYDSFEAAEATKTGNVPLPDKEKESLLGGHAIVLVGYSRPDKKFIFRNSWGTKWGDKGYGTLPYAYVLDRSLASDFWVVQTVE